MADTGLAAKVAALEATVIERTGAIFKRLDRIDAKLDEPEKCPTECNTKITQCMDRIEVVESAQRNLSNRTWVVVCGVVVGIVLQLGRWAQMGWGK